MRSEMKIGLGTGPRTIALVSGLAIVVSMAAQTAPSRHSGKHNTKKSWDFEKDEPGKIARGFTNEVGQWEVNNDNANKVLYQKAKNEDATFNVTLVQGTSYKDIDLSVKLKAVAGETDRGGGLVWRAKDAKNYYIAATTHWKTTTASTRSRTASGRCSRVRRSPVMRSGTRCE